MTTQTKKYLKIILAILFSIGKLTDPKPLFLPWDNPIANGRNLANIFIIGAILWLLYSAGRTK
jgi:hypothetical protein